MKARGRCISALVMPFNRGICFIIIITVYLVTTWSISVCAGLIERVVAIVNNEPVLYSRLQEWIAFEASEGRAVSESEALDTLIQRVLIMQQARKIGLVDQTYLSSRDQEDKVIETYIERRVKALIHVPFSEIEDYYRNNTGLFGDRDLYEVWDEIEAVLREGRLQMKLDDHVAELRKGAYIRIQLDEQ